MKLAKLAHEYPAGGPFLPSCLSPLLMTCRWWPSGRSEKHQVYCAAKKASTLLHRSKMCHEEGLHEFLPCMERLGALLTRYLTPQIFTFRYDNHKTSSYVSGLQLGLKKSTLCWSLLSFALTRCRVLVWNVYNLGDHAGRPDMKGLMDVYAVQTKRCGVKVSRGVRWPHPHIL